MKLLKSKYKLICLLLAAVLVFCACGDGSEDVSDTDFSDISDAESEVSEAYSEYEPNKPFNQGQEEILELIEKDVLLTDLFINGEVCPNILTEYSYTTLESSNVYHDFSAVENALNDVYSAECDVAERYLSYPTSAAPVVKNSGGVTSVCRAYVPGFNVEPDISTAEFLSFSSDAASVSVKCSDGRSYVYEAVKAEGKWRLTTSLFFMNLSLPSEILWEDSGLQNGQNEGSAKRLCGDCLIVNIFVDDAVSSWKSDDIDNALRYISDAAFFLENEAAVYGTGLRFNFTDKNSSVYIKTSKNISSAGDDLLWIELMFADTVYRTLEGCAASYFDLDSYDNWCVLIHVSKSGRSYAIPCNSDYYDHEIYSSERAVMFYSADASKPYYSVAANYAHELLHLFGAQDLYEDTVTSNSVMFIKHFFPNEIMFNIHDDIGTQAVSPYTAYRVGWSDTLPEPFDRIEMK